MYDIAIIGLGPAGASFARLINSQKYRVVAFDKKNMQDVGGFRKPCGGLLSPGAQRALAKFNGLYPAPLSRLRRFFMCKRLI